MRHYIEWESLAEAGSKVQTLNTKFRVEDKGDVPTTETRNVGGDVAQGVGWLD